MLIITTMYKVAYLHINQYVSKEKPAFFCRLIFKFVDSYSPLSSKIGAANAAAPATRPKIPKTIALADNWKF